MAKKQPPNVVPWVAGLITGAALWCRKATTFRRRRPKLRVNEFCPCGSGIKWKHCHGAMRSMEFQVKHMKKQLRDAKKKARGEKDV